MESSPLTSSLAELIALRTAAARLLRHARRSSRTMQSGGLHTPFRGRGMEYAESRPYALGDDARHIDWRVSARSGQIHSKLFHPERDRVSAVVIDGGPAMHFATRGVLKSVQANRLAALFVWHAVAQGDRVTGQSFPHNVVPARAGGGERGALRLLQSLLAWQAFDVSQEAKKSLDLPAALNRLERNLRSGAHVLVALDSRSISEDGIKRLRSYAQRHDLLVCVLVDPIEIEPLPKGRFPVSVSLASTPQDRGSSSLQDARQLQAQLIASSQRTIDLLKQSGLRASLVRTDEDPAAALSALLAGRRGWVTGASTHG